MLHQSLVNRNSQSEASFATPMAQATSEASGGPAGWECSRIAPLGGQLPLTIWADKVLGSAWSVVL